jgi:hypothetical protein
VQYFVKTCDLRIDHKDFGLKICGFAICGLAHPRNLLICDSGMIPKICGFAICGLLKQLYCPPLHLAIIYLSLCNVLYKSIWGNLED